MDSSDLNRFDIFEIYQRYCVDITSGNKHASSREELAQLLKLVESGVQRRNLIFVDLSKLMAQLNFMVDSCEFTRFYDFVFFVCRQNGQKNITVCRALAAWRLVLDGRFRLLNQWCEFVEKNQRHNISEDTWQQVLAFSRCVHEDLEGYDPKGAWPVLIDDFVEHMYRITRSKSYSYLSCGCNCEPEAGPCVSDDSLPGLNVFSGLKRKSIIEFSQQEEDLSKYLYSKTNISKHSLNCKKGRNSFIDKPTNWEGIIRENDADDCMEIVNSNCPVEFCSNCQCAVEGSLSKGFAGLLTTGFDKKSSVSST
ncbi:defective in cullin neddylation protein AAR3-like isoform X3 [Macadamia integrifolia]|uniref:defective in cullin neddylation protein AAR3-like isoform X3 n=1 Tax=Macadamia integrifolia TaxID=60698 RepID=UPI001C4F8CA2|nr:defective in cullin neddylation protein AAR3-like isoform X3 [Macadamia integrifolia]